MPSKSRSSSVTGTPTPESPAARLEVAPNLSDRAGFELALQRELSRHVLAPGLVAVLVLGLDGHATQAEEPGRELGDPILAEAARRLTAVTRPRDTVAFLGAGHFGVLVDELMSSQAVLGLAERLLSTLGEGYRGDHDAADGPAVVLSASGGVAVTGNPSRSPAALIAEAAAAYRHASEGGGDRFELADPQFRRLLATDPAT